jgi:hypothetical protein
LAQASKRPGKERPATLIGVIATRTGPLTGAPVASTMGGGEATLAPSCW